MGDLTDDELRGLNVTAGWLQNARNATLTTQDQQTVGLKIDRAVEEIRRHRAAQTAAAAQVRQVVRTACLEHLMFDESVESGQIDAITERVASQLACTRVESGLSLEEREALDWLRRHCRTNWAVPEAHRAADTLDRLLKTTR